MSFKKEFVLCCDGCDRRSAPAREDCGLAGIAKHLQFIGWTFYEHRAVEHDEDRGARIRNVIRRFISDVSKSASIIGETLALCPTCTDAQDNNDPRRTVQLQLSWSETYDIQGVKVYLRVPMDAGENDIRDAIDDGYWYSLVAEQVPSFADRMDDEAERNGCRKLEHRELLAVDIVDDNVASELPEEL